MNISGSIPTTQSLIKAIDLVSCLLLDDIYHTLFCIVHIHIPLPPPPPPPHTLYFRLFFFIANCNGIVYNLQKSCVKYTEAGHKMCIIFIRLTSQKLV